MVALFDSFSAQGMQLVVLFFAIIALPFLAVLIACRLNINKEVTD
jgi:hypothetical protein